MTLEIMVPREVGGAVRALVALRGRRLGGVLPVARKAHLAGWRTRVGLWRQGARESECAVSRIVAWVGCNELMVMLVVVLGRLLGRSFAGAVSRSCTAFCGRSTRHVWPISIAKAGNADGTRLHLVARNTAILWDDERLRDLGRLRGFLCGFLRDVRGMAHGLEGAIQTLNGGGGGIGARLSR